jgi:arylsulfatase A-like enzyme
MRFFQPVLVLLALCLSASAAERPNILFIFTDDQTYRSVSCYEGAWPWAQTPHLDDLARQGIRFQNAYSGPWCSPSRAMMMSGLQLHALERPRTLRKSDGIKPVWQPALKKNDYRCGFIGKWDLPPGLVGIWDHSVVWHASGEGGVKFDPMHYYTGMSVEIDGGAAQVLPGYSTDTFTQHAADFIQQNTQRPWFLWLCLGAPHVPSVPPPRHTNLYADAQPSLNDEQDLFGPRMNVPAYQRTRSEVTRFGDRIEREFPKGMAMTDLMRRYAATVRGIDDVVGALIESLRTSGQLERTLIVFTSDDGMPFGEHGFVNKTGPYDACQRVPLIARGPGVTGGHVCMHPVAALDLIPTLLAAADVPAPYPLHGHDLTPLLRDPSAAWPHAVLLESFGFEAGSATHGGVTNYELKTNRPSPEGIPWWILLREGRFKYIRTLVADEIDELYDLEADPGERRNLAVEPAHRATLLRLRQRLETELQRSEGSTLASKLPKPAEAQR